MQLVERTVQFPDNTLPKAANAVPQWRRGLSQHISHVMACRAGYARWGAAATQSHRFRAKRAATLP